VSRWVKTIARWETSPSKAGLLPEKFTLGLGCPIKFANKEEWLDLKFQEFSELKKPMSPTLFAILIIQAFPDFKEGKLIAVRSFVYEWMEKQELVKRRISHSAATDEAHMGEDILEAVLRFRDRRQVEGVEIPLALCYNMDETAVDLSETFKTTIARRGQRHVAIRLPKRVPKRVTVLLTVGFHGAFLKPLIVFQAMPGQRVEREVLALDGCCLHAVQINGWCDRRVMVKWASEVLGPHVTACRGESNSAALLMMDNFKAHKMGPVARELAKFGTHPHFLPANTTSKTQPLDVGLNKAFKEGLSVKLMSFLAIPGNEEIALGREQLSAWIGEVWGEMEGRLDLSRTLHHIGYIDAR
jgi:hypothetical protein